MATFQIDAGLARLFKLGLDADMAEKVDEWKSHLDAGELTEEMRTVFYGIGYLSSMRDPRVRAIGAPSDADEVEIREPARPSRGIAARLGEDAPGG